jgi:hypothetical protein
MAHRQVVTPSILEELQFCNPYYQLRLLRASSEGSGVVLADLEAPQNLHRLKRLSYSLLYSMVCLFLIQNKLLMIDEHLASISKISKALKHFVRSGSR